MWERNVEMEKKQFSVRKNCTFVKKKKKVVYFLYFFEKKSYISTSQLMWERNVEMRDKKTVI